MEYCYRCAPLSVLSPNLISDKHVGIRFGKVTPGLKVYLDGEDVTNQCPEALAGNPGWAIVYSHKKIALPCGNCGVVDNATFVKKVGKVEIDVPLYTRSY